MTVSEIAQVTGKSRDIVLRAVHDLLPGKKIEPKKKIVFTQEEAETLLKLFSCLTS